MFRTVPLSIIRSLFTVHSAMVHVIQVCRQLSSRSICSCSKAVYKPVWHIQLLSVQWINSWWWTDELSETCRVSSQNKFCEISASSRFYYKWICIMRWMDWITDIGQHLKASARFQASWTVWPLKMESIGYLETSATNYHPILRTIPVEKRPQQREILLYFNKTITQYLEVSSNSVSYER